MQLPSLKLELCNDQSSIIQGPVISMLICNCVAVHAADIKLFSWPSGEVKQFFVGVLFVHAVIWIQMMISLKQS